MNIVRHKNLNKVLVSCVVSMAEESFIVPRRPYAQIVRPHQWHVTKGGLIIGKEFWEGG